MVHVTQEPCPDCEGTHLVDGAICDTCRGQGTLPMGPEHLHHDALHNKLDSMVEELDYIHGKVTAIWNAVKHG